MKQIGPFRVKLRNRNAVIAISQTLAIAKKRYIETKGAIPSNEIAEFEQTMNGQLEPPIHIFTTTPTDDPTRYDVSINEPYTEALRNIKLQAVRIASDTPTTGNVSIAKSTLTPWQYKRALNLYMARISIQQAEHLHTELGKFSAAIVSACNALILLGAAGVPSFDAVEEKARSDNASKGGRGKAVALNETKDFCRNLYREQPNGKKHQSKLKAIRERVIDYAKEKGQTLSYDQFIKTASGWVSDIRETQIK